MTTQTAFSVVAMFYSLANLGSMGLELKLREALKALRSVRVIALTLGWCWVVGPALARFLATRAGATHQESAAWTSRTWPNVSSPS